MIPGFSLFERDASFYPDSDYVSVCVSFGCDALVLKSVLASREKLERVRATGLPSWVYEGPNAWMPGTWRATAARIEVLKERNPWLVGVIVDMEDTDESNTTRTGWHDQPLDSSEAVALVDWMIAKKRAGWSVGFSSYNGFRFIPLVARMAGTLVFSVPQVYGIISPAPPEELAQRARTFQAQGFSAMVPALAMWSRTPTEQAEYLAAFPGKRGIFWHTTIQPSIAAVVRAWRSGAGGAVGMLVLLLAVGGTWWYLRRGPGRTQFKGVRPARTRPGQKRAPQRQYEVTWIGPDGELTSQVLRRFNAADTLRRELEADPRVLEVRVVSPFGKEVWRRGQE